MANRLSYGKVALRREGCMNTINGTIDSVSMNSLCRPPIFVTATAKKAKQVTGLRIIETALVAKRLAIHVDVQGGITGEWSRTNGNDIVKVIISKWFELGGLVTTHAASKISPPHLKSALASACFKDTGDKLIVRLAIAVLKNSNVGEFFIGTTDSDFWDPRDIKMKGNQAAAVASALQANGIRVLLFSDFMKAISA